MSGSVQSVPEVHPAGYVSDEGDFLPWNDPAAVEGFHRVSRPFRITRKGGEWGFSQADLPAMEAPGALAIYGQLGVVLPEHLGSAAFREMHRLRYAYYAGAMANGIATVEMVQRLGRAGMLGFFGAAGLPPSEVQKAITRIQTESPDIPYGFNLIHSPNEQDLEAAVVDLYLRHGIRLVEASAYLNLTLPVVRYRVHGIHEAPSGEVVVQNRVIAKISRAEVASRFLAPPPEDMLRQLVAKGEISETQARLATRIPMADDITAEADSAGHTGNNPALTLLPSMLTLRDRFQEKHRYRHEPRVGLGGGIATPEAAMAAFSMGAAYIVTGSVNQACVESGTSDEVRQMLAEAEQADVAMAPAADMFEMNVRVQVLKRGTMFAVRASKLHELYRTCGSIDEIPAAEREKQEKTVFRAPLTRIWDETKAYFAVRDPLMIDRAEKNPKLKMALIFRWYLGQSSHWAKRGESARRTDYQIWCGPAMGAFNEWTAGTFLAEPRNRDVVTVAMNLMFGAAVLSRVNALRGQGFPVPGEAARVRPRTIAQIEELLQ